MNRPRLSALVLATLALPASASAATLTPDHGCYVGGASMAFAGAGFTRGSTVTLGGALSGAGTADAGGAFAAGAAAPVPPAFAQPGSYPATATDASGVQATTTIQAVRAPAWSNAPVTGPPTQRVRWRFAGFFVPGRAIYGHVRFRGHTVTNHRFGVARGSCGTLTARAPRVPLRRASLLRSGAWSIKLDQARGYHRSTPGRVLTFRISRS